MAVLVSFAVIALAWYIPVSARYLGDASATARAVTVAWYVIAAVALVFTGAAMRDQWHRYWRRTRLHWRPRAVIPPAD